MLYQPDRIFFSSLALDKMFVVLLVTVFAICARSIKASSNQCNAMDAELWSSASNTIAFSMAVVSCAQRHFGHREDTADCLLSNYVGKLTASCAGCFGETAECSVRNCFMECFPLMHPTDLCGVCMDQYCTPRLRDCMGASSPFPPSMNAFLSASENAVTVPDETDSQSPYLRARASKRVARLCASVFGKALFLTDRVVKWAGYDVNRNVIGPAMVASTKVYSSYVAPWIGGNRRVVEFPQQIAVPPPAVVVVPAALVAAPQQPSQGTTPLPEFIPRHLGIDRNALTLPAYQPAPIVLSNGMIYDAGSSSTSPRRWSTSSSSVRSSTPLSDPFRSSSSSSWDDSLGSPSRLIPAAVSKYGSLTSLHEIDIDQVEIDMDTTTQCYIKYKNDFFKKTKTTTATTTTTTLSMEVDRDFELIDIMKTIFHVLKRSRSRFADQMDHLKYTIGMLRNVLLPHPECTRPNQQQDPQEELLLPQGIVPVLQLHPSLLDARTSSIRVSSISDASLSQNDDILSISRQLFFTYNEICEIIAMEMFSEEPTQLERIYEKALEKLDKVLPFHEAFIVGEGVGAADAALDAESPIIQEAAEIAVRFGSQLTDHTNTHPEIGKLSIFAKADSILSCFEAELFDRISKHTPARHEDIAFAGYVVYMFTKQYKKTIGVWIKTNQNPAAAIEPVRNSLLELHNDIHERALMENKRLLEALRDASLVTNKPTRQPPM